MLGRRLAGRLDQTAKIVPGYDADHAPSDPPVRGDDERAGEVGNGDDLVELGRDVVARLAQAWVAHAVILLEGPATGRVVGDIHAHEASARGSELTGRGRQLRCLVLADRAP